MDGCEDEANIDLPVWVLNVFTILLGFGLAFTHALERAAKSIFTYQSNTRYKRGHHACLLASRIRLARFPDTYDTDISQNTASGTGCRCIATAHGCCFSTYDIYHITLI